MDGIIELAKMFKTRENEEHMGIQIGKIISNFPDIQISLGDKIILTKKHLIFSSHLLNNYIRKFEISELEEIKGDTKETKVGIYGSHKHELNSLSLKGLMKWTDGIKIGDEVLLIPTEDEQLFYAADIVRRLE